MQDCGAALIGSDHTGSGNVDETVSDEPETFDRARMNVRVLPGLVVSRSAEWARVAFHAR
jgi:hypothetical protein